MTAVASEKNFNQRVYDEVKKVPRGSVATYGQIAALCGNPRAARAVGWALRSALGSDVPWQRIVASTGYITIVNRNASAQQQKLMLEAEGIEVTWDQGKNMYHVDLDSYLYRP